MVRSGLEQAAARALLWWRSRPHSAAGMIRRRAKLPSASTGDKFLRVAVVQLRAELSPSLRHFAARMEGFVRAAAEAGAELLVFPAENGTQLFGLVPGLPPGGEGGFPSAETVRLASPYLSRAFAALFAALAGAYRLTVVAGSIRETTPDGRLVEAAYCFGPEGELLGRQERLHLRREEAEQGFSGGTELLPLQAGKARLVCPLSLDAYFFEPFRVALATGVDLAVLPAAEREEKGGWSLWDGLWARVQESPCYGLASHLVGSFFDVRLAGRSGIYVPVDLTPGGDGILALAEEGEETLLLAELDLLALHAWRKEHPPALPFGVIRSALFDFHPPVEALEEEQPEKEREEELPGEDDEESPAAAQAVAQKETEVKEEDAPPVGEEKKELAPDGLGEEDQGEDEEVGGGRASIEEEAGLELGRAPEEPGQKMEEEGVKSPGEEDQERSEENDP